jgi:hypothetical protein
MLPYIIEEILSIDEQGFGAFLQSRLSWRGFLVGATGHLFLHLSVLLCSFPQNGPLLGSVGSFDWAGGAFLYTSKDKVTFINTTRVDSDMNDAYLGK